MSKDTKGAILSKRGRPIAVSGNPAMLRALKNRISKRLSKAKTPEDKVKFKKILSKIVAAIKRSNKE